MAKTKSTTKKAKLKVVKPVKKTGYGQNGSKLDLDLSDLNTKERRLLGAFSPTGPRGEYTIEHLSMVFGQKPVKAKTIAQAQSWVRNSLRRLVRAKLVEHVSDGTYRVSLAARSMIKKGPQKAERRAA